MDNIVIIGSSGHAKVVADSLEKEGKYRIAGMLDRFRSIGEQTLEYPILGKEEDLPELVKTHDLKGVLVAIGDNYARSQVVEKIKQISPGLPFVSSVHPTASIAMDVSIGEGTVIMAGVVINTSTSVGCFCILNTNSSLDHDSVMQDFSSLAPGVTTGGWCRIEDCSAICIGATLLDRVQVGEHTVVGAGSLVIKPVDSFVLSYGTPAETVRNRKPGDLYV